MFEGMDVDLMKQLRKAARERDLKNREVRVNAFRCECGDLLTIEDGLRCRQCVLEARIK